jgi:hypothetical protein
MVCSSINICCNCGTTMGGFIKTFKVEGNCFCAMCFYNLPENVRKKEEEEN